MRKITKIRRSVKAVSPVISVLLMIAIAVSAALVAFAWVSGYLDFTTAKIGKQIQVQSVATDVAYVQNTGDSNVLLVDLYVNGVLDPDPHFYPIEIGPSETSTVTPSITWEDDPRVTIKIVTSDGLSTEHKKTFTTATGTGGTTTPPPTVTRVISSHTSFSSAPQQNDLLIVIAGHRSQATDSPVNPTLNGYDLAEVARFKTPGSSSTADRRVVAVFYRVADGSEGTSVPDVDWETDSASSAFVICQAFRGAALWTEKTSGPNHGTASKVTSLTVPSTALSSGSTANVLSIGAMVWRVDSSDNLGGISFTDLPNPFTTPSGTCRGSTAYNYGLPVTQTTVTWTSSLYASGALVQFECK
ncbi:MAG: hypothetical protein QCH99_04495 [Candidatus Bathyarchaeota archaeon]|nr:hypothetical protein [Candidatus Bathyarchaeum tardum]